MLLGFFVLRASFNFKRIVLIVNGRLNCGPKNQAKTFGHRHFAYLTYNDYNSLSPLTSLGDISQL